MDLGAGAKVLLGVREEIMWTCADNVGATDFWIGDGELGVSRGGTGAHELLCEAMSQRLLRQNGVYRMILNEMALPTYQAASSVLRP